MNRQELSPAHVSSPRSIAHTAEEKTLRRPQPTVALPQLSRSLCAIGTRGNPRPLTTHTRENAADNHYLSRKACVCNESVHREAEIDDAYAYFLFVAECLVRYC
jgi:hypothetical protein